MSQLASRASAAPLILVLERGEHAIFVSEIKEEGRTRCCFFFFCVCVCVCVCVFTPSQPGPLDQGEEIKEEGRTRCCFCVCVFFYAQPTWTIRPGRRDQRGCACNLVTTDNSILYTPLPSDRVLTVDGKLLITVQNNPYSNTAGLSTTNEQAGLSTTNWTNSIYSHVCCFHVTLLCEFARGKNIFTMLSSVEYLFTVQQQNKMSP